MDETQPNHNEHSCDEERGGPSADQESKYPKCCNHDPATQKKPSWYRRIPPEWINAISTAFIAVFTFVLTYASIQQSIATSRQLAVMESGERPWVRFKGPETGTIKADEWLKITLPVINDGKSPARIREVVVGAIVATSFPTDPDYSRVPPEKISQFVIFPGMTSPTDFEIKPTRQKVADILAGTRTFFIYSRVRYTNMRTNTNHKTTFCAYYSPRTQSYRVCKEYNDAD